MIRWKPASDGYVESHDGHWKITPNYWGCCVRAQSYRLEHDGRIVRYMCDTQRDAKVEAERLIAAAPAEDVR